MSMALVDVTTLHSWLQDGEELALFDVREHGQYGESHLLFAVSLPYSRLELDVVRLAPRRDVRMVLVDDGDGLAQRAAQRLGAIGYSRLHVLLGGNPAWQAAGHNLFAGVNVPSKLFGELVEHHCATPSLSASTLHRMLQGKSKPVILDGRPVSEYHKMNIPGAICCPNGELAYRIHRLVRDADTPVVINCAGRTRSIIGAQTLKNLGLANPVHALENGTQGWYLDDLQLEHGQSRRYPDEVDPDALTAMRTRARNLALACGAREVSMKEIIAWQAAADRTTFLCDVRTDEEYREASVTGAQHAPGGQLVQATDHYIGVRNARIVLIDSEGLRAYVTASWLQQLGHQAFVLIDPVLTDAPQDAGIPDGLTTVPGISAARLLSMLTDTSVNILDVRSSQAYRQAHIPGSVWTIRPHMPELMPTLADKPVIIVADNAGMAALAASELPDGAVIYYLEDGLEQWADAGGPVQATPTIPTDSARIDYLFFVHDRHDGNKEAARRYLSWELGLIAQAHDHELAVFSPYCPSVVD